MSKIKMKSQTLKNQDMPSLAEYIKSEECRNIVLMLGAGISTAAGIPDFRSPETGLYANLARLNLPYPEAVFEINFFKRNPVPFYTLAHELYPGKYRPTLTHSFIKLLADKGKLQKCFTQNIDTLERIAGVPEHKIIEAHGSFASQRCVVCKATYPNDKMKEKVMKMEIVRCEKCNGLVKPDIVFFGESLPPEFTSNIPVVAMADLLMIIGTSLTVHPFASLAGFPPRNVPRVLINMEKVGDIGSRADDVVILGKCDEAVRSLCKELGWEEDLDRLWAATKHIGKKGFKTGQEEEPVADDAEEGDSATPTAEEKVEDLVEKIETSLALEEKPKSNAAKESEVYDAKDKDPFASVASTSDEGKVVQGEPLPKELTTVAKESEEPGKEGKL